jgi:hypothetical protein
MRTFTAEEPQFCLCSLDALMPCLGICSVKLLPDVSLPVTGADVMSVVKGLSNWKPFKLSQIQVPYKL